jgi:hypothetical protein
MNKIDRLNKIVKRTGGSKNEKWTIQERIFSYF